MRAKLESAWGASVTEAMGIGDISVSLWGECEEKQGMHFSGRGFVHIELIDPHTEAEVPIADGAELARFRAKSRAPIDVQVNESPRFRLSFRDGVEMEWSPVDLVDWVREAVAQFEPAFWT